MRFVSNFTTSPTSRIRLCALLAGALLAEAIALGASLVAGVRLQAPAGTIAAEPADVSAQHRPGQPCVAPDRPGAPGATAADGHHDRGSS